ncbi:MAG: anti-sigma factor family protein, partial [Akkermansiaceae bacterium]
MKIEQDDPRLTAYVLGELSPKEAKQFDHAIAGDPALKLAVQEIERTQSDLLKMLGSETDTLLPKHRSAIMRAAREASGSDKIVSI